MHAISPVQSSPSLPPINPPLDNYSVPLIAVKILNILGWILVAGAVGCFIASLHIPAVALQVTGCACLILVTILRQKIGAGAGTELMEKVDILNAVGEYDQAVPLIRKSHFDDPSVELERLRAVGILTPEVEAKLNGNSWLKILYGQAMEIKRVYKDTHYTFIHAQNSWALPFTYFLKELAKQSHSEEYRRVLKNFKFLRVPASATDGVEGWELDAEGRPTLDDAGEYINRSFVSDSQQETKKDLISSDAYFYNQQGLESSHFFLKDNSNIDSIPDAEYIKAIRHFYPLLNEEEATRFATQIQAMKVSSGACGNLFVIAIPKEGSNNKFFYRAHPFGVVCRCHPVSEDEKILEELQSEKFPPEAQCNNDYISIPQYRIFSGLLNPEIGGRRHRSFLLTPFNKAYRKELKGEIRNIVAEIDALAKSKS
jgi:hypothetical protein